MLRRDSHLGPVVLRSPAWTVACPSAFPLRTQPIQERSHLGRACPGAFSPADFALFVGEANPLVEFWRKATAEADAQWTTPSVTPEALDDALLRCVLAAHVRLAARPLVCARVRVRERVRALPVRAKARAFRVRADSHLDS